MSTLWFLKLLFVTNLKDFTVKINEFNQFISLEICSLQHVIISGLVPKVILPVIAVIVSISCLTLVENRFHLAEGWRVTQDLCLDVLFSRCEIYPRIQVNFTCL